MLFKKQKLSLRRVVLSGMTVLASTYGICQESQTDHGQLEEIIVTAQKYEKSLQKTTIAISTLGEDQLETLGIRGLAQLAEGIVPSLRIQPYGNTPSTLIVAMRGNSPIDPAQIIQDGSVAIYLDGIYMGRGQGLAAEQADLERIEVLRGPQGTLAGRNATGGAINLISKQLSGELSLDQFFSAGNFGEFRSTTHLQLPEIAGIKSKVDFLHSRRDGWVNNTAAGETDYNAYDSTGGRLTLAGRLSETFTVDYQYDQSRLKAGQMYFQLYQDNIGAVGVESGRQDTTRYPVLLSPTITKQQGHSLIARWQPDEQLMLKSLTSYRGLEESTNSNYGGVLYANGLNIREEIDHNQLSQEFQFIGSTDQLEWVAGLFYFKERGTEELTNTYTLDVFGCLTGIPGSTITPTNTFQLCDGTEIPGLPIFVDANSESRAIYGQAIWTPPVLEGRFHLTLGLRYTEDEKTGFRTLVGTDSFGVDTEHTDPAVTIDFDWTDNINTYLKWSSAYRAGGANLRSTSFSEYGKEEAEAFELGIKSELFDHRLRFNAAIFKTNYDGMQIVFANPQNIAINETINAANTVEVDGIELDMTLLLAGWQLGVNYSYLDTHMPLQPNPLAGGVLQRFEVPQAPEHAGSFTADYRFVPTRLGTFAVHLSATSTSQYAYFPANLVRFDAYTLWNARLDLTDISLGDSREGLKLSAWVKNLTDEEYVVFSFPVGDPAISIAQAYGTPRTFGLDIRYQF